MVSDSVILRLVTIILTVAFIGCIALFIWGMSTMFILSYQNRQLFIKWFPWLMWPLGLINGASLLIFLDLSSKLAEGVIL